MSAGPTAVALVSGGMDSCVAAAMAAEHYSLAFLHFDYGQRTEGREARAFDEIAEYFQVDRKLTLSLDLFSRIGGSSLTDLSLDIPDGDLSRRDIPNTYVPFRNAFFLSAAVSWAEVLGAAAVVVGVVEEDSSGYPDCRKDFLTAFEHAAALGTRAGNRLRIETPVIGFSKHRIVRAGVSLNAPLHLTWSCYQSEDRACGRCDSCLLRLRGFSEAGVIDPVTYDSPSATREGRYQPIMKREQR